MTGDDIGEGSGAMRGTKGKHSRIQVTLPAELIEAMDVHAGSQGRSRFIREAVEEKLRRSSSAESTDGEKLAASLKEMAGSLADYDIPGWKTREAAAEWVRALRRGDPVGVVAPIDE